MNVLRWINNDFNGYQRLISLLTNDTDFRDSMIDILTINHKLLK